MPLETFTGRDISRLLAEARRACGPDAVLHSLRRAGAGTTAPFELVAGDPASVRRAAYAPPPAAASLAAARAPHGTAPGPRPAEEPPPRHPRVSNLTARPALTAMTPHLQGPLGRRHREPAVIALVGPTGAGKTTTLAKLARHPKVFQGVPVGLICLDTYRIGALEQLRVYAELSRLPLEVIYEPGDVPRALKRLRDCEVLLVDTAGRGPAGRGDAQETRDQLRLLAPVEVHLTLPAGLQPRLARRVLEEHRLYGVTHLLATKLDEFPEDQTAFELAAEHDLPMRWCTDGQEVPMDLQPAAPRLGAAGGLAPRTREGAGVA